MGKHDKSFEKSKNYFLICIAMSLVIIFMSIIGYVLFDMEAKMKSDENINYFTEQSFNLIEERLALIKRMMVEVSSDELITTYIANSNVNYDIMKRAEVIGQISKCKADKQNIRQIFICNKEQDYVISDSGYSTGIHAFLRYILEVQESKMDDLYSAIFHINDICIMRYDRIYKNGSFLVLAPMYNRELKERCMVGVVVEERFFEDILDRIKIDNKCILMIVSEQGEIISANDETLLKEGVFSGINEKQIYWNSIRYRIFFNKSEKYGVVYYNLVPKNKASGDVELIRAVLIFIIALSGVLFVGLWLLFSKKNYKILNAVIHGMRKLNTDIEGEEAGYIESAIESLYTESDRINKLIKDNSYILQGAIAHHIINDTGRGEPGISKLMDYFELDINNGHKRAAAFMIDVNYTASIPGLINRAYESFAGEIIAVCEGNTVVVVFLKDSYKKECIDVILDGRTEAVTKIGIGMPYLSPDDITKSCSEAKEAIRYICGDSKSIIIEYEQIVEYIDNDKDIRWDHNPFVKLLMQNKAAEAAQLLDRYIEREFKNRKYIREAYLISVIINMAHSIKNSLDIGEDITKYYNEELSRISLNEMKKLVEKYFMRVADMCYDNAKKDNCNKVVEYILAQKSFEFDLNRIAMDLGVNPSYLSRKFKLQTGENYTDYIRRLKINETKRLLTETDMPLNEIAEIVNYGSDSSLIKVFKKELGITPTTYRERERMKK